MMGWFKKAEQVAVKQRIEPSFPPFMLPVNAFEDVRQGWTYYKQCPPLATAVNRIIKTIAGLDLQWYQNGEISKQDTTIIQTFQQSQDMAKCLREIQTSGRAYVGLVGNVKFASSKIVAIEDVSELEDADKNVYQLIVSAGRYKGTYNQLEYGSDIYNQQTGLASIILIRNQVTDCPLSPISAAVRTIIAGYNQNYKTIINGGRNAAVYNFAEMLDEVELSERRQAVNARHQQGGIIVTSGGDLTVQELGLTAKDMDWLQQLEKCEREIYNFMGVPLALVSSEASTFNNVSVSASMFYEDTVLPFTDYFFGIIGAELAKRSRLKNVVLKADRETIDALQTKRLEQLKMRKEIGVETINELRRAIYGREDVEGGDQMLVDTRLQALDMIGQQP